MKKIQLLFGSLLSASTILAATLIPVTKPSQAQTSCRQLVNEMFSLADRQYHFYGTYASTGNHQGTGLGNTASQRNFYLSNEQNRDVIEGSFDQVFPQEGTQRSADKVTVRLYRDGRGEIILNTWGDATFPVNFTGCTGGNFKSIQGLYIEHHPKHTNFSLAIYADLLS